MEEEEGGRRRRAAGDLVNLLELRQPLALDRGRPVVRAGHACTRWHHGTEEMMQPCLIYLHVTSLI